VFDGGGKGAGPRSSEVGPRPPEKMRDKNRLPFVIMKIVQVIAMIRWLPIALKLISMIPGECATSYRSIFEPKVNPQ